jgi:hypothetical protein
MPTVTSASCVMLFDWTVPPKFQSSRFGAEAAAKTDSRSSR